MAATVLLREWFENDTATAVDKTSGIIRFKAANNALADLNDPLVRGGATVYSYEKYLMPKITVVPVGNITLPVVYSDGTNTLGTGLGIKAGTVAAWAAPINTASATATTSFFDYNAGAPLSIDTVAPGTWSMVGDFAQYLVLQASVAPAAAPGMSGTELLTLSWNET